MITKRMEVIMSWLKCGVIGAIVGAAVVVGATLLSDETEEPLPTSIDFPFGDIKDNLQSEQCINPEVMPEA
jgi:hypothetical protein